MLTCTLILATDDLSAAQRIHDRWPDVKVILQTSGMLPAPLPAAVAGVMAPVPLRQALVQMCKLDCDIVAYAEALDQPAADLLDALPKIGTDHMGALVSGLCGLTTGGFYAEPTGAPFAVLRTALTAPGGSLKPAFNNDHIGKALMMVLPRGLYFIA